MLLITNHLQKEAQRALAIRRSSHADTGDTASPPDSTTGATYIRSDSATDSSPSGSRSPEQHGYSREGGSLKVKKTKGKVHPTQPTNLSASLAAMFNVASLANERRVEDEDGERRSEKEKANSYASRELYTSPSRRSVDGECCIEGAGQREETNNADPNGIHDSSQGNNDIVRRIMDVVNKSSKNDKVNKKSSGLLKSCNLSQ